MRNRKRIVIIGGGISGLTLLHFLKKKGKGRFNIKLLEKNNYLGGSIFSERRHNNIFEHGPNAFLGSKQVVFDLIEDLGLSDELIKADRSFKRRYVLKNNRLIEFPTSPQALLFSKLLSAKGKFQIFQDLFCEESSRMNESVYSVFQRHFGEEVADFCMDPFLKGVYGGDAKQLSFSEVFPKLKEWEKENGSILKSFLKNKKTKDPKSKKLFSLKSGMGLLGKTLFHKHQKSIFKNTSVEKIEKENGRFHIQAGDKKFTADHLICATQAYAAAELLRFLDPEISHALERVEYAPIAVAGLSYRSPEFKIPKGFGYLIPSSEKSKVLGCLFENQIFHEKYSSGDVFFRVMIGGSSFPEITEASSSEIQSIAQEHVLNVLKIKQKPDQIFLKLWGKAIPQYTLDYSDAREHIQERLAVIPKLHLRANYLSGVSLNDSIQNSHDLAEKILS